MKKIFVLTALVSLLSAFTIINTSKKDFEGVITYDIEYLEVPEMLIGMESMLPATTTMYIKGDLVKVKVPMAMGGDQIVVMDNSKQSGFMLMDLLGQKIAVRMTKEDLENEEDGTKPLEITYVNGETKKIVGYKCKKAMVFNPNTGDKSELYYTDAIKNSNQAYKDLQGMPLQYTTNTNDTKSVSTASEVEEKKLSNDIFEEPEGYDWMTMEELKNMGK